MSSLANIAAACPESAPKSRRSSGTRKRRPRILLVTPELSETRFLGRNGKLAPCIKAGGLADVSAALFDSLSECGADVHVAMPHFRSMYQPGPSGHPRRLHLSQDNEFSQRRSVYDSCQHANVRGALAFQRDVINDVLPRLRPDLVHCHDWMAGLVPAAARTMGIPSLFTLHNQHDQCVNLGQIENTGMDAGGFWQNLYFKNYPGSYENARHGNSVSLLASGIMAADEMNTVSHSFLGDLAVGGGSVPWEVTDALRGKLACDRAHGIINSPPASISPERDPNIVERYDSGSHVQGKLANKRALQQKLGLEIDDEAPILFWPSRLDPTQKGCQLLAEILHRLVSDYWALGLQVVFVADGPYHDVFQHIAGFHQMRHRIAVCGFSESLSRLGYAGSDYILMPSAYEPCGLAQMVGLRYGSLPIVHSTGGLRDTVTHMDLRGGTGNGFIFENHDASGLRWAIDEAMRFHISPAGEREATVTRIMRETSGAHSPESMVAKYLEIYKRILRLH
ncbi:MAG: glycogen synthase [Verrucomicrobiaceae bacterium]|nr:MAG: glycogen synthase [Verrucomicrobiaceae bacterium]